MPETDDLDLLVAAARRAGDLALPYWRNQPESWEKDAGAGPVTEADHAVNDMLEATLRTARPDYGWLSEESEDGAARLACENVFIIDPIDGTRAFIAGDEAWAHSLAVARDGQVVAAVIYLPAKDKLYAARLGGGAVLNGAPIHPSDRVSLDGATVLSAKNMLTAERWNGGAPPVQRHFRPSLAYRMALVAEGRFDAMLTLRDTWEWDVAAGTLIVHEAGGLVADRHGNAPRFNNRAPLLPGLLAAPAPVLHGLLDRLSAADGGAAAPA